MSNIKRVTVDIWLEQKKEIDALWEQINVLDGQIDDLRATSVVGAAQLVASYTKAK